MKIAAVIIAGGKSERMGGTEKVLLAIRGKSILQRIIAALVPQVDIIAINANHDPTRFEDYHLPVIPDIEKSLATPLAGLHAALHWAQCQGHDRLLSVPSDTPFLPANLVKNLNLPGRAAAVAASQGQVHYLTGLWSTSLAPTLAQALAAQSMIRAEDWVWSVNAASHQWPAAGYDPFFNINTPEDLAEAERLAAEFNL